MIEKLLNEVSLESLVNIVLSDSLPEKEKEETRRKIKNRLAGKYNWSKIKNGFIDNIVLNTLSSEEKLVERVDDWLAGTSLDELVRIIAGAIVLKEKKKKIICELWKTAKRKIQEKLKDKKILSPEDIVNLSLLYISLGGKEFLKESEIMEKIEDLFVKNYERKDNNLIEEQSKKGY